MQYKKYCERIRDYIDNREITKNREIEAHIKECKECRAYSEVSNFIREASFQEKRIELWGAFVDKAREYRFENPIFKYAGVVIALIILFGAGLGLFWRGNEVRLTEGTNVVRSNESYNLEIESVTDYEGSPLNYYYEISAQL